MRGAGLVAAAGMRVTGATESGVDGLGFRVEVDAVLRGREGAGVAGHVIDMGVLVADNFTGKHWLAVHRAVARVHGGLGTVQEAEEAVMRRLRRRRSGLRDSGGHDGGREDGDGNRANK